MRKIYNSTLVKEVSLMMLSFALFSLSFPIIVHWIFWDISSFTKLEFVILLITLLVMFCMIIPIGLWVRKKIVDPIETLCQGTTEITKGNLDYDFSLTVNNELSTLAENLNEMTQTIEQQQRTLEHLIRTDPLTGLANRRHLDGQLNQEIERYKRTGTPFSLIVCDIDDFKKINDCYGHLLGDTVLVELGSLFVTNLRKIDLCSRFGGEEFVLLLPNTSLEKALIVADKLHKEVKKLSFNTKNGLIGITVTMGISSTDNIRNLLENSDPQSRLLELADKALYRGKKSGKNRISL